tara:strand:- start:20359 stop:20910 length:552 start_codon:yes stop_codon:yes gene_type:complete
MRIIAGLKKSTLIRIPKGFPKSTRPTTDRVKESLFNILTNKFDFSRIIVLDLFSGSGSISFEFVSRGCSKVYSVDNNEKCTSFIKKISQQHEFNIKVFKKDYKAFINKCDVKFDVIFIDPPYNDNLDDYLDIINLIKYRDLISNKGEIVIEHSSKIKLHVNFKDSKERKFGSSVLTFIKKASL